MLKATNNRESLLTGRFGIPALLTVFLGLVLSFSAFNAGRNLEEERLTTHFKRAAGNYTDRFNYEINGALAVIRSINAVFDAFESVDRERFRVLTRSMLEEHSSIQALEWVPRVKHDERADFEEAAHRDGFSGFRFTERADTGGMRPAGARDEYFPVYYVEPLAGNEAALGFDLASNPVRRQALEASRDTGLMVASGRIRLVQNATEGFGFRVFQPLFPGREPLTDVRNRRERLTSFILGVFHIGDLVEAPLETSPRIIFDIYLYDLDAPEGERFLYFRPSRTDPGRQGLEAPPEPKRQKADLRLSATLTVGGRTWQVLCVADPEYVAQSRTLLPWGILTGGLLASLLLTIVIMNIGHKSALMARAYGRLEEEVRERKRIQEELVLHQEQLDQLVRKRTAQLAQTNQELQSEVAEREEAQQGLTQAAENQTIINQLLGLSLTDLPVGEKISQALDLILSTSWLRTLPQGGIFLTAPDEPRALYLAAHRGLDPELLDMCRHVPFGRCHCGRAALTGEMQFSRHIDERHENHYEGMPPHGHYNVPLVSGDRCLGVIVLYLVDGREWRRDEADFLNAVSQTLAKLIESDLTSRALRDNEARMRSILDTAVEGIITIDNDGVIQSFNRAAEHFFGYRSGEVIGRDVGMLQPEAIGRHHQEYVRRYLETGKSRIIGIGREVEGCRKDGSSFPLYLSVSEVRLDDQLLFTGILRDITELKEAEKAVVEARRAAESYAQELQQALGVSESLRVAMNNELIAASALQRSLLPQRMPQTAGLEVAWEFLPSAVLGGDIFNVFFLDDRHLGVYILDVSGHGVPAALLTFSLSQSLSPRGGLVMKDDGRPGFDSIQITPPARVLEELDRLYPVERFDKTFTIFYLVLDLEAGRLTYSRAGHPPAYLLGSGGNVTRLESGGPLMGLGNILPFEEETVTLESGDRVVLLTDGVLDYENPDGAAFGEERFLESLSLVRDQPVDGMVKNLSRALEDFGRGLPPKDDVSLLAFKWMGLEE